MREKINDNQGCEITNKPAQLCKFFKICQIKAITFS
jgi:hypothetical protein